MGKNTIIIVLVALAIYFVFVKPTSMSSRPPAPRPPAQPTGGGFVQGLENAAPALGSFIGKLFGGSSSSGTSLSSGSSASSAAFHDGVWDPSAGSAASSDDYSFPGYDSV